MKYDNRVRSKDKCSQGKCRCPIKRIPAEHRELYFGESIMCSPKPGSVDAAKARWRARSGVSSCTIRGCHEESCNGFALCGDHLRAETQHAFAHDPTAKGPQPTMKANSWITRATAKKRATACDRCQLKLCPLLLVECGHLVCPECITEESLSCPVEGCGFLFNIEWFSFMQPSFEVEYV
jgi:hypothetical protein